MHDAKCIISNNDFSPHFHYDKIETFFCIISKHKRTEKSLFDIIV